MNKCRVSRSECAADSFEKSTAKISNCTRKKFNVDTSKIEYMVIGHRRHLNKGVNDLPDFVL